MKHIGWRLEVRREQEHICTFVFFYDRGVGCPINDDGTWNIEFNWILYGDDFPPWKQTEIGSITKFWAEE
jgi:hypothetical protein